MRRALAPAEIPVAAWRHIHALPDLYRQRGILQGFFSRPRCQTAAFFQKHDRLQHVTRQVLEHEAALVRFGIRPDCIPALLAPAEPARHETGH